MAGADKWEGPETSHRILRNMTWKTKSKRSLSLNGRVLMIGGAATVVACTVIGIQDRDPDTLWGGVACGLLFIVGGWLCVRIGRNWT